jgi:hypothetical protein
MWRQRPVAVQFQAFPGQSASFTALAGHLEPVNSPRNAGQMRFNSHFLEWGIIGGNLLLAY